MLAYDRERLHNTFLKRDAVRLYKAGMLNRDPRPKMDIACPGYSTQSKVVARIGLFVMGFFLFGSICTVITTFTSGAFSNSESYQYLLLVFGIIGYAAVEGSIRSQRYYGYGIDDAFLVCGQGCLLGFVGYHCIESESVTLFFACMAFVCGLSAWRYVDALSTFFACAGITGSVFSALVEAGTMGKLLLPFAMMVVAGGLFALSIRLRKQKDADFYHLCLKTVYGFSAILFCLAGNYLVVRKGNELLMNLVIPPNDDIPYGRLFWIFTFGTPLFYLYLSLKHYDRLLLWIAIPAVVFSVITFREYHSILPIEWALTVAGLLLFGITYWAIRKLKGKAEGLTFEEDSLYIGKSLKQLQSIATVTAAAATPTQQDAGTAFGGGKFGGGGAGDNF